MRGSLSDTLEFESLEPTDGPAHDTLVEQLWGFLFYPFRGVKKREAALEFTLDIHSLFCDALHERRDDRRDDPWEIPSSAHYRTRNELIHAKDHLANDPPRKTSLRLRKEVVQALIDYELIQLHPRWPRHLRDHPQAPYRPIVSHWWNY